MLDAECCYTLGTQHEMAHLLHYFANRVFTFGQIILKGWLLCWPVSEQF